MDDAYLLGSDRSRLLPMFACVNTLKEPTTVLGPTSYYKKKEENLASIIPVESQKRSELLNEVGIESLVAQMGR